MLRKFAPKLHCSQAAKVLFENLLQNPIDGRESKDESDAILPLDNVAEL